MSTCKYCRCHDERACAGGCYWLDPLQTICSRCTEHMTNDELELLLYAELPEHGHHKAQLTVTLVDLLTMTSTMQLALRHPSMEGSLLGASLRTYIQQFVTLYDRAPGMTELIKRGFDPQYEVPMFRR